MTRLYCWFLFLGRCSIANCAQALLHFFQNYFDALRRDAEKQFKSAIKQQPMIGTFLMLGKVLKYVLIYWLLLCFVKVYLRLDQPLAALEVRWDYGILSSVFTFSAIQYVCLEQVTSRQVYRTGLDSFPSEVTLLVRSILVDSLCDVSSYPRSEQSMHRVHCTQH